jgi:hypothetical protein
MKVERLPHILSRNKNEGVPQKIIFLDVETKIINKDKEGEDIDFWLAWGCYLRRERGGGIRYKEEWRYFEDYEELNKWIISKTEKRKLLYLISSNIWFDLWNAKIHQTLTSRGWTLEDEVIKNRVVILPYRKDGYNITALNFQNFYPWGVEVTGKKLGLEKMEVNFEEDSKEYIAEYCRRDCEILVHAWHIWVKFLKEHHLGNFSKTLAGQALSAFRHRFMTHRIYIHTNPEATRLEREAYFGGRTECFFLGEVIGHKLYQVDVNSMYPYVMWKYKYPYRLVRYYPNANLRKLKNLIDKRYVIAKVRLDIDEPWFPTRHNHKVIFPVGEFWTVLCTEGLRLALKKGWVEECVEMCTYEADYIFKDYAIYFHNLKEEYENKGNYAFREIAKLFNNSLYGKFGEKLDEVYWAQPCDPTLFERELVFGVNPPENSIIQRFGGWEKEIGLGKAEGFNSFPAICAHVTENTRLEMYSLVLQAGKKNCYYMDTDSLIINQNGYDRLRDKMHPTKMGMLKIEGEADYLNIRGLKDYIFGEKEKIKGVRGDAIMIEDGKYWQKRFPSAIGMMRKKKEGLYRIEYTTKTLRREYDKGVVGKGGRVEPYHLKI